VTTITRMTVCVDEAVALRPHRFVSAAGQPVAWLNVGDAVELCVYGSPAALRRLGEEAIGTADAAEELAPGRGHLRVVAGRDGDDGLDATG
jgi:hypothetical protein